VDAWLGLEDTAAAAADIVGPGGAESRVASGRRGADGMRGSTRSAGALDAVGESGSASPADAPDAVGESGSASPTDAPDAVGESGSASPADAPDAVGESGSASPTDAPDAVGESGSASPADAQDAVGGVPSGAGAAAADGGAARAGRCRREPASRDLREAVRLDAALDPMGLAEALSPTRTSLFAFPAMDNFAGVKYPLEWIGRVQNKSTAHHKWKASQSR
jgi:hypothetical protein